ncbi:hypothetical protein J9M50_003498 [Salmonella enterica]|nr:hypothetical protein [Salmonella enterica]EHI9909936.1 hypothetical protein [Salmonella enterica]EHJ0910805.1 hypothetical protein [Salmonella enterica]HEC7609232.1 hypothetical protein [Salmonella enterica subsp. enterica serovar Muenchen]
MFKLRITLINHQSGERRKLVSVTRYKSREDAWSAAKKMAYLNRNEAGERTYECAVRVVEA